MAKRRRRNQKQYELQCKYIISIHDWHISIIYNDHLYKKIFETAEFEERISLELGGKVTSTTSKKM